MAITLIDVRAVSGKSLNCAGISLMDGVTERTAVTRQFLGMGGDWWACHTSHSGHRCNHPHQAPHISSPEKLLKLNH
jgi:hypothetical protein